MKMKVGTRILFSVFLAVIILVCICFLFAITGVAGAQDLTNIVATMTAGSFWYKFLYGAIMIVVIVICFILMFFGIKQETPKTAKIAAFESGSILITVKAIEELVERYVRETKEVKELQSKVVSYSDYIDISVEIAVAPDGDIPEITKNLQTGLAAEIEQHTGITVKQTKIQVMSIDDRHKNKAVS